MLKSKRHTSWRALIAIGVTLVCVFAGVAYLQLRQSEMLAYALLYQDDNIIWAYFQLETEQLHLLDAMQRARHGQSDADQLQERYDIFVSRIGIIRTGLYKSVMQDLPSYQQMQTRLDGFVNDGDQFFRDQTGKLDGARLARLEAELQQMSEGLHDLSLQANESVAEMVDGRNRTMKQHIAISNWLMGFEWLLILGFGTIVFRQLRQLERRKSELERLTSKLEDARNEAETASLAKSAFLANMSHEIRTPLNGVLGMLSLLADSAPSPNQTSYINTAEESAKHLLLLLNDVLDASKLESGKLELAPVTCNLPYLLRQIVNLLSAQAQAKNLTLGLELVSELPEWVVLDPTRLRQILLNLLSNAVKFTEHGGISVQASVSPGEVAGEVALSVLVTDTGIGMDEATMARLFKRFSQGDGSTARQYGGSGLGLEISQSLAQLMRGNITVTSKQGQGSSFHLSLPLQVTDMPALELSEKACPAAELSVPIRILVVDDNAVNRKYMLALLERMGQAPSMASDGPEALTLARKEPYDLVLMDLHMPVMDGLETTRRMRLEAMTPNMKIIALTADAFPETCQQVLRHGLDDFLSKPLHREQLLAMLLKHFPPITPSLPVEAVSLDSGAIADFIDLLTREKYLELVAQFFSSHMATYSQMEDNIHQLDRVQLFHLAHSMKGGAVTLGFTSLAQQCLALEQEITQSNNSPASHIQQVLAQYHATRDACVMQGYLNSELTPP
ncbi:ATP-binding protein [Chromobacterium sp. IIBBL 290-4]|uniref:ATP-binding protein n=1 Tax=Chromobacterium sp. IIBBL 290-4 TaxID=2953890 RepID=UPI0020B68928|nr:ATP-binding protein [Chromobacterium sp. IIBBL 290-4]UTH73478.1 ATP-binding protein [Chromobacterium sp. IIBBL 290-4]